MGKVFQVMPFSCTQWVRSCDNEMEDEDAFSVENLSEFLYGIYTENDNMSK